jgi:xanthine dehydrogenase iron-sulfur cluster and FAD-binding subunit A
LQVAFHKHGAAQCGICTPGMLIAAADLLARNAEPDASDVKDALGGVLCRCTGYQKIIEAVLDVANQPRLEFPPAVGEAVGPESRKSTGLRNSPARSAMAQTRFRPMRCGCA